MAEERRSLFSRLMEGKEKDEDYARSTLPTNRWQLFWDIMKGRFGKLVLVNLLMLIFFIPLIALIVIKINRVALIGILGPFGANLTIGYPAVPNVTGLWEQNMFYLNTVFYLGFMLAAMIAAIGVAGGSYVIRNMIWTEGVFVANDFWKGIKQNIGPAIGAAAFFSFFLFIDIFMNSLTDYIESVGGSSPLFVVARVASIVVNVIAALMALWMISLGANYHQSPLSLVRNAFVMMIGTIPQTLLFAVTALLPIGFLFMGGSSFLTVLSIMFYFFVGISYALLSWMSYTQWAFDRFVNPSVKGAKVGRGLYNPNAKPQAKDEEDEKREAEHAYKLAVIAQGKSNLMARPMKPIDDEYSVYELPQSFSREDLQRLRESKNAIVESQKAYEDEHKNDPKYAEYNKQFEEREKALRPETKKNGKAKKQYPNKMLGK